MLLRSHGLNARVAGASILLAVVVIGGLASIISTVDDLRTASRESRHSAEVVATANRLQRLAVDLESGARGYVITQDPAFLEPVRSATAAYPFQARRLERLVQGDPVQRRRAAAIAAAIDGYRRTWADPLVASARADPAAARKLVATARGKRQMDALRRRFGVFVDTESRLSARRDAHAEEAGRRGIVLGVVAAGAAALLIVLYGSYLVRLVTMPVRGIAGGARRLAAGELSTRVPERGVGEIGELARDFNTMAQSLDDQHRQIVRRNVELQAVLDATLDGILMADAEGNVLFSNRTMDRFSADVGVRDQGTIWDRMIALARRTTTPDAYYDAFARIAADPATAIGDEFTVAESGRTFTAYTVGVEDATGRVIGRIFSIREITALRESERLKDEFVATVSHELRTPLTSIVGYAEVLLARDDLGETTRQYMEVIDRNAHRLQRLVGDLLFFAQVEARQLQLDRERIDLRALATRALEAVTPAAEGKGLSLELEAPEALEVDGDASRLGQLLDNLLSNAVKFTHEDGRVCLRLRRDGAEALLEVADTGIGVPPEDLARLFRRFFRSTSATALEIPGTGLGLAIAKAIVDAHGGTIEASSSERGTTFTVRLPLAPSGEEDLPVADVAAPSPA
jgi:two-component system phosphate regulon sensor histidine kinase PhoR